MKNFLIVAVLAIAFFFGKSLYMQPSVDDGEKAPGISATLADGSSFNLSDLQGNYILIDFWGSWCGPCISEIPEIKALHNKFAGAKFTDADGFYIVSVAIEKGEKRWRRALERFQMPWKYQICDKATSLRFFDSPIAAEYGVKEVPTKILIDAKGNIIGVNQSPGEIADFLEGKRN